MGLIRDIISRKLGLETEKTEEEIQSIVDRELKVRQYFESIKKERVKITDSQFIKNLFLQKYNDLNGKNYVVDDNTKMVLWTLVYYFSENENFLKSPIVVNKPSLEKGLLLVGGYGSGKTSTLKTFHRMYLPLRDFGMQTCNYITSKYDSDGPEFLQYIVQKGEYCFDDLGTEENGKHYGKNLNVMKEILEERYYRYTMNKTKTHVTTNLSNAQIKERYGDRIGSRISEMFNVIQLHSQDFRRHL